MARMNRRDVLADSEIQVVHCINRCVRRAYLCGQDPLTGADYERRRELIRQRMEYLAGSMGIEVLGYAVMSNHFHCVLRSRHDVVATWSDDDVAQKWWMLCPARKDKDGSPAKPTEFELNSIRNDAKGMKEKRIRLSSISWFMRFLSERVAKEANRQDQCSGRFWEGRFKSQVLLDDAAILACLQYVDLNPVRAKIATSIESSDFTSAQDRIVDAFGECSVGSVQCSGEAEETPSSGLTATFSPDAGEKGQGVEAPSSGLTATFSPDAGEKGRCEDGRDNRVEDGQRAGWLAPIELREECSIGDVQCSENRKEGDSGNAGQDAGDVATGREVLPGRRDRQRLLSGGQDLQRRASNKGCLSMGLGDYLQLLDWTGRQIRGDKRGAMPANLEPLFERLGISTELWVDFVVNFRKWFRSSVGRPKSMEAAAESRGQNRAISISSARRAFTSSESMRQQS